MKMNNFGAAFLVAVFLSGSVVAPLTANAQSRQDRLDDASHHRQQTKNNWRNIGAGAGAVGLIGLLKGNTAVAVAGLGGAAYSASRYEHDRKSQAKIDQARRNDAYRSSHYHRTHRRRHTH